MKRGGLLLALSVLTSGWAMAARAELVYSFDSYAQGRVLQSVIATPELSSQAVPQANPNNSVALNTAAPTSAVPEAETWALMMAGVLAVGWMHTRRRR